MKFPLALQIVREQTLPGLVQIELEKMILDGRFAPGQQLREVPLAAMLGTSRGPIREAFRGLEEKKLVSIVKNIGVFVRRLDIQEVDQIYEVRICLEALIGRKVASSIDARGLESLDALVGDMRSAYAAADIDRYSRLNLGFHDTLAGLSGNASLHHTYRRLVNELALFRRQKFTQDEGSLAASLQEHQAIAAAIARRDAELTAALLAQHAADSRARLHRLLAAGASVVERSDAVQEH